ncbi:hypothetical protein SFRURICE_010056 [Spodoptera frugiperda]|nr:hypothetical protein SFRURICE_010056 [Spodoptera frugiperda]
MRYANGDWIPAALDYSRASILQYNKTKGLVRISYVDHGDTDVIPVADIRELSAKWLKQDTLDFMRRSLIHKECYVRVPGDEVNGVLPIELRYESLWVSNINTLPLQIVFKDEAVSELYNDMAFDLQYEVVNMSPLDGIFENKACVALCPKNYNWYHASILQYNKTKGLVRIKYVDHGDTDIIPVADIRELSTKWLKHPPANFSAKLFGIHLNREKYINVVAKHCTKLFRVQEFWVTTLVDVRYSSGG